MISGIIRGGSTERSITLQTHLGNNIKNLVELPPGPREINKFKKILSKHSSWEVRRPPYGVCNCVGHVWANRRTCVVSEIESNVILLFKDDGYRVFDCKNETVWPGDLVT